MQLRNYFASTKQILLTRLMRGSIVGALVLVFMVGVFTQTTYAKGIPPNYAQASCLSPSLATYVVGPNELTGIADITNDCPANVSASANISARITDCPGIGTNTGGTAYSFNVSLNQANTQQFNVRAGCVVCVNHKPSYFPPFHVQVTLSSIQGTFAYRGTIYRTGATPSSVSETDLLGNNPPEIVPRCP